MKRCFNCQIIKPLTDFYRKGLTGTQSRCKACNAEVCRPYRIAAALKTVTALDLPARLDRARILIARGDS